MWLNLSKESNTYILIYSLKDIKCLKRWKIFSEKIFERISDKIDLSVKFEELILKIDKMVLLELTSLLDTLLPSNCNVCKKQFDTKFFIKNGRILKSCFFCRARYKKYRDDRVLKISNNYKNYFNEFNELFLLK